MSKKTFKFLAFAIIAIVVIVAALWYFLIFRGSVGPDGRPRSIRDFFPFGRPDITVPIAKPLPGPGEGTGGGPLPETGVAPRLRQVSDVPTSGAIAFLDVASDKTKIRYVERATGHIFETLADDYRTDRISNTTVRQVYEAYFVEDGEAVIMRLLDEDGVTIESFYGSLARGEGATTATEASAESQELDGVFLPDNILSLAVSPDTDEIAYVERRGSEASALVRASPDGKTRRELLRLPLTELLVGWPADETVTILTKPSAGAPGYFYEAERGVANRIATGFARGLTALLDSTGTMALVGTSDQRGYTSSLIDRAKGNARRALPAATFADKCLWSRNTPAILYCAVPKGGLGLSQPDSWYQGLTALSDDLYRIDTETGAAERVIDLSVEASREFDLMNLMLDPSEEYILFIDKNTLFLWSLRLE
ncbi:MAG: hypothetical protein Q8R39_00035 [bacterium]|nr:hypothetical protein [bacterium]MDZ4284773.1 hypothetical protein [Patescibacteria group bacterium]